MSDTSKIELPTPEQRAAYLDGQQQVLAFDGENITELAKRIGEPREFVMQLHLASLLASLLAELTRGNSHLDERDDCQRCRENREMREMQLKMMRHQMKHIEDEERGDDWKPPE